MLFPFPEKLANFRNFRRFFKENRGQFSKLFVTKPVKPWKFWKIKVLQAFFHFQTPFSPAFCQNNEVKLEKFRKTAYFRWKISILPVKNQLPVPVWAFTKVYKPRNQSNIAETQELQPFTKVYKHSTAHFHFLWSISWLPFPVGAFTKVYKPRKPVN